MKTDDFVSYDLAQRLKEVEFKEHCKNAYLKIGRKVKLLYWGTAAKLANDMGGEYVSAPNLWQAQKWLREKWDWHIIVEPQIWDGLTYEFKLWHRFRGYENTNRGFHFSSYERALSAGIYAALELIEQEKK